MKKSIAVLFVFLVPLLSLPASFAQAQTIDPGATPQDSPAPPGLPPGVPPRPPGTPADSPPTVPPTIPGDGVPPADVSPSPPLFPSPGPGRAPGLDDSLRANGAKRTADQLRREAAGESQATQAQAVRTPLSSGLGADDRYRLQQQINSLSNYLERKNSTEAPAWDLPPTPRRWPGIEDNDRQR